MKAELEKIENNTAKLRLELDEQEFDKALDISFKKNKKRFLVPGFRKGKAPRNIVEMQFGPAVLYEDAAEHILPRAYKQAVQEHNLEPVDEPKFDIEQIEKGKPLIATIEVTVKPPVEIKEEEYIGLEVEKVVYNVTEEEIEKELKTLQEKNARLVTVEGQPAEMGDTVIIDFEGSIDGELFEGGAAKNYSLELGSKTFIEGFEEQIVGMNVGETKNVNVKFPEDYNAEDFAGKDAVFKVTLKEVKKKELLTLDDEFAKDVSEFETLEELKKDLENKLEQKAKFIEEGSLKSSIIDKLINVAKVDVPQVMIDKETDRLVYEFSMQMRANGLDLRTYLDAAKIPYNEFREKFKDEATVNVKVALIFEEIAKQQKIEVTEEDLDEALAEIAKEENMSFEEYKEKVSFDFLKSLTETLLTNKVFDFLIEKSKITAKDVEALQDEPEDN